MERRTNTKELFFAKTKLLIDNKLYTYCVGTMILYNTLDFTYLLTSSYFKHVNSMLM